MFDQTQKYLQAPKAKQHGRSAPTAQLIDFSHDLTSQQTVFFDTSPSQEDLLLFEISANLFQTHHVGS